MDGPRQVVTDWLLPVGGGLAAGFVAGLFGVGGGVLLVPVLVLLLQRPQHVAHATSLVAIMGPAAMGAARFSLAGEVDWLGAGLVAAGAVVGTQAGAAILRRVPERELRWIFAALLVATAVRLLVAGDAAPGARGAGPAAAVSWAAHVGVGLVSGTASALLGIGGGAIIVPALVILLGYDQHLAEGTSLAVILPTALVAASTHARRGYTEWALGWRLGAGGVPGALAGAQLALTLPSLVLARAFAGLLMIVTVLLVRRPAGRGAAGGGAAGDGVGAEAAEDAASFQIRPLTSDQTEAFLAFFDRQALHHGDAWPGCYCYYDRAPVAAAAFDPGDAEGNRAAMARLLAVGLVRGWLAYDGDRPVAWCHATSRIELPHLKVGAPLPHRRQRVGVVACFVVASSHRGSGVLRGLLDAACQAFTYQGFAAVEAYPPKAAASERAFRGGLPLYLEAGFEVVADLDHHLLVRKRLHAGTGSDPYMLG